MASGEYGQVGYSIFQNQLGTVTLIITGGTADYEQATIPSDPNLLEKIGADLQSMARDIREED